MINFINEIHKVFPEESEEYKIISEVYDLITSTVPTVASEAKTHLVLIEHSKIKLSTIYFMIRRMISSLKNSEQYNKYDAQYTRLVKLGRPSKDAIESEIRTTNPDYVILSNRLNELYDIQELVSMYIKCLDSSRMTTIELLRNINRID